MIQEINKWVSEHQEEIFSTFHHLHTHPEISWEEKRTTAFIKEKLEELAIPCITFEDQTGIVGLWGEEGTGSTIGVRADMDALWQNVQGGWKANHSCGHDAHMTMLLNTIRCLKDIQFKPNGLLKIIFQPAEESGTGALSLINKGIINDIDCLLGIHVRPIQELLNGKASPAIYHGAATMLKGKIYGVQAHGARPHLGTNVVDSLASIIQAVNAIKMDPTIPYSAKVTAVKAGEHNYNIIPDYAEFGIDVRAQTNEVMNELLMKIERAVVQAASANGASAELEATAKMVAAVPNPYMEEIVGEAIMEALSSQSLCNPPVTPGGEDFHFYTSSFPHLKATMVGLGTGLQPGLHHPNMNFELASLLNGIKILSLSIIKLFEKERK